MSREDKIYWATRIGGLIIVLACCSGIGDLLSWGHL